MEDVVIDGVKLIGWPAEIVKNHEELRGKYRELFERMTHADRRMAALEGKLDRLKKKIK
jgi:predicted nuclease with TOPRIM domain